MKIIINGAFGRMGRVLTEFIENGTEHEIAAAVDIVCDKGKKNDCFCRLSDFCGEADCIIDFSDSSCTDEVCSYAVGRRLPLVIAATGQSEKDNEIISAAARFIPVLRAANLSREMAVFRLLVSLAASKMPDCDIEITEIHRRSKADIPSGTALMLARDIIGECPSRSYKIGSGKSGTGKNGVISIHSLRFGENAGTHTVYFAQNGQTLTLSHESHGRLAYAVGAIQAAVFIYGRAPGLYSENDLFGFDKNC